MRVVLAACSPVEFPNLFRRVRPGATTEALGPPSADLMVANLPEAVMTVPRHYPDGSINHEYCRLQALKERDAYLQDVLGEALGRGARLPALTPRGRRRAEIAGAALVVATGAFWAIMLTSPPTTQAADPPPAPWVLELNRTAPLDLDQGGSDPI